MHGLSLCFFAESREICDNTEDKDLIIYSDIECLKYMLKLTLATKIVDPSLPACKLLITSGGMFGLLRIEGGKFINPGAISGPCPPGNGPPTRCNALRACSPSGSCNTFKILKI